MKHTNIWLPSLIPVILAAGARAEEPPHDGGAPAYSIAPLYKNSAGNQAEEALQFVNAGLDISLETGAAYDSNALLTPRDEISSWLYLLNVGIEFNPFLRENARGPYAGFDVNGSFFAYESAAAEAGRDSVEGNLDIFAGLRGAKTDLRVDGSYDLNNGNSIDYSGLDRETRRADSNEWDVALSAMRKFAHSRMNGSVSFDQADFAGDTGLNDTKGTQVDLSWLFEPGFAPKMSIGLGLRGGWYETDRNFNQQFVEPSVRAEYALGAKTTVRSRFGYEFITFDGPGAIDETGSFSSAVGLEWRPLSRTTASLEAYRDFSPSLVTANENYTATGFSLALGQQLPWRFTLAGTAAYEHADYYATLEGAASGREDNYWRYGLTLSRPFRLVDRLDGQASAFYYFNTNDSTLSLVEFDQHFTGLKVGFTY